MLIIKFIFVFKSNNLKTSTVFVDVSCSEILISKILLLSSFSLSFKDEQPPEPKKMLKQVFLLFLF